MQWQKPSLSITIGLARKRIYQAWKNSRNQIQEINFEDLLGILEEHDTVIETWAVFRQYKLDARPLDSFANPDKIEMKTYLVGLQYEDRLQLLGAISDGDELKLISRAG